MNQAQNVLIGLQSLSNKNKVSYPSSNFTKPVVLVIRLSFIGLSCYISTDIEQTLQPIVFDEQRQSYPESVVLFFAIGIQAYNNSAERAIKPFEIWRKNWIFTNTANGANASVILYSMIEIAKANELVPFD